MAFVEVGLALGASEAFAGIVGSAAVGAAVGGGYSAITGDGNVLNSALTGATIGGAFGAMAPTAGFNAATASLPSTALAPTSNVLTQVPAASLTSANPAALDAFTASKGVLAEGSSALPGAGFNVAPSVIPGAQPVPLSQMAEFDAAGYGGTSNGVLNQVPGTAPYNPAPNAIGPAKAGLSGKEMLGYGLAGTAALSLLGSQHQSKIQTPSSTSYIRPYNYAQVRNPKYGQPGESYYIQSMDPQPAYKAASGGLMGIGNNAINGPVERMSEANAGEGTYPGAFLDHSTYATPSQMPTSAEVVRSDYDTDTDPYTGTAKRMAFGGPTSNPATGIFSPDYFTNLYNQQVATQPSSYIPTSQGVQDYNKILADRAVNEYIKNPILAPFMPASDRPPIPTQAPVTPVAPVDTGPKPLGKGVTGLYQYYLGRNPLESELGQWSDRIDPNSVASADSADYFNKFTKDELAKTGYKPKGEAPFVYDAPIQRVLEGQGAHGGLMPNSLRFREGGDKGLEGLSEKEKKEILLDMMAQSLKQMPGQEYTGMMNVPQGAFGRVGASKELDDNSRLRAGLSGVAMAAPGQQGVKTMPGNIDVGYTTARNSDYDPYLDLSAYRSINPMPGRGHAQGVNAKYTVPFMAGGQAGYNLGGYSDGGRLLKGPGDGMSDNIPASIGNRQPARLADGEFVIPADVVSHLGNGSTDAGAKKLYAMMDKVRQARTGTKKQGKQIKADKYLKT
jgi:hypothetical protein